MKKEKYRKFEIFTEKNGWPSSLVNLKKNENDIVAKDNRVKETLELKFENEIIMYQKFSGNVRGYDVIFVGGIKKSDSYVFKDKKYIDVETIEKEARKEIADLLVDSRKSKKRQEAVYFYDMEHYQK